jgi:hypothetical protein
MVTWFVSLAVSCVVVGEEAGRGRAPCGSRGSGRERTQAGRFRVTRLAVSVVARIATGAGAASACRGRDGRDAIANLPSLASEPASVVVW